MSYNYNWSEGCFAPQPPYFSTWTGNEQYFSDEPLSQHLFGCESDLLNNASVETAPWDLSADLSMLPHQTPDFSTPQHQTPQPTTPPTGDGDAVQIKEEIDIKNSILELRQKTSQLQELMDTRVVQVEEQVAKLQSGLEEQKARLCKEIDEKIEDLRAWARQVKLLLDKATEERD